MRRGDDGLRRGTDGYDLAMTGVGWALLDFDCVTTSILRDCTGYGSGNNGVEDVHRRVNFKVYNGGKVSS